jgi:hypothetical protein
MSHIYQLVVLFRKKRSKDIISFDYFFKVARRPNTVESFLGIITYYRLAYLVKSYV